jgi:hypothetical protein
VIGIATVVCAGALLPSALASAAFLHVSPSTAPRGSVVVFTGSVAQGCDRGGQVTLISRLFPGHAFGGEGAITTRLGHTDTSHDASRSAQPRLAGRMP